MSERIKGTIVYGKGPIPCDVMIIGEAPGADEDEFGEPFIGRAGKRLNEALISAGLNRNEVYITNVYKLRPPNNRKPTEEEILAHQPILWQELKEVKPKFILLLGNTALESCGNKTGVTRFRGVNLATDSGRVRIYATYHPSATFRSKEYKIAMFDDIADFARIVQSSYISSS